MKIINAIISGLKRALDSWKGILIIWFVSLVLVSLVVLPMKSVMKAGLGTSMITEKFAEGFNVEAFSDMGATATSLIRSLSSGLLLLVVLGVIVNAFLSGGLFSMLKRTGRASGAAGFFSASAKYFWSFLVITLIVSVIIVTLVMFIIVIPVSLVSQSDATAESTPYILGLILSIVFILLLMILLLVADYARAWQVANEKRACFKALGFGFGRTFSKFLSSFPMMILLVAIQVFFGWLVLKIIGEWRPSSGIAVFLLFIISQIFFMFRIMLRAWRYGSVTVLKEENDPPVQNTGPINSDF
jgi:hypothetical protein